MELGYILNQGIISLAWQQLTSSALARQCHLVRFRRMQTFLLCFNRREGKTVQPLKNLSILDVGCGGGLFTEALARLGADVTGIDTSATAITVAEAHAQADPAVASRTTYRNVTAEQMQQEGARLCELHPVGLQSVKRKLPLLHT